MAISPSEVSRLASPALDTNLLVTHRGGPLQRLQIEQLAGLIKGSAIAGVQHGTTTTTPDPTVIYIVDPGTYSNFPDNNGNAQTVQSGGFSYFYYVSPGVWGLSFQEIDADFSDYVKMSDTLNAWLKNPRDSFAYNAQDLQVMSYVTKLDITNAPAGNYVLDLLQGNAGNYQGNTYNGVFEIYDLQNNRGFRIHSGQWTSNELTGTWFFNGDVTSGGITIHADVELLLDKMPNNFEYHGAGGLNLVLKVNSPRAGTTITNAAVKKNFDSIAALKVDIFSSWLLNPVASTDYTPLERQAISYIKYARIINAPSAVKNNVWGINLLNGVNSDYQGGSFSGAIEIADLTRAVGYRLHNGAFTAEQKSKNSWYFKGPITSGGVTVTFEIEVFAGDMPDNFSYVGGNPPALAISANSAGSEIAFNKLKGKVVQVKGDSISVLGAHMANAAKTLGFTLRNKAIGGTTIKYGYIDGQGNNSQQGMFWKHAVTSGTQTNAEAENLIANWSTISQAKQWYGTDGYSVPTTLTDGDKAEIRASTIENTLLNGLGEVDYLILCDSFNSWFAFPQSFTNSQKAAQFTAIPTDIYNRYTYIGAINFIIREARKINPGIRVIILGHYENTTRPAIAVAQTTAAGMQGCPIIKMWEETGWTNIPVPNTQQLWNQAPYNGYLQSDPETVDTSKDMPFLRWILIDGVHTHLNTIADQIYEDIMTTRLALTR